MIVAFAFATTMACPANRVLKLRSAARTGKHQDYNGLPGQQGVETSLICW